MDSVKKKFPPELINRLDDVLVFTPIGRDDLINIVDLLIGASYWHTMRAELIGHFKACMTEIYLHIDARMADYIRTHP